MDLLGRKLSDLGTGRTAVSTQVAAAGSGAVHSALMRQEETGPPGSSRSKYSNRRMDNSCSSIYGNNFIVDFLI